MGLASLRVVHQQQHLKTKRKDVWTDTKHREINNAEAKKASLSLPTQVDMQRISYRVIYRMEFTFGLD
ncbi:hypothetical protein VULLAG_LOCUS7108 [Vulpes lagopus]